MFINYPQLSTRLSFYFFFLFKANKYSIRDRQGVVIGYICEEDGGIGKAIVRNVTNTHRSLKADVLDAEGRLLFRVRFLFALCALALFSLSLESIPLIG